MYNPTSADTLSFNISNFHLSEKNANFLKDI
jgi:hypothetical protein